jgi:hypothetical protein
MPIDYPGQYRKYANYIAEILRNLPGQAMEMGKEMTVGPGERLMNRLGGGLEGAGLNLRTADALAGLLGDAGQTGLNALGLAGVAPKVAPAVGRLAQVIAGAGQRMEPGLMANQRGLYRLALPKEAETAGSGEQQAIDPKWIDRVIEVQKQSGRQRKVTDMSPEEFEAFRNSPEGMKLRQKPYEETSLPEIAPALPGDKAIDRMIKVQKVARKNRKD